MSGRWLSVVGIGEDGLPGLAPAARALVDAAEVFVGGARHLEMLGDDGRPRIPWPSPLRLLVDTIAGMKDRRVCVLATGDPMCFGIGTTLARRVPLDEMLIVPAPSAQSLAAARLGWPAHETRLLTLHGRPLDLLNAFIQPGARLIILAENAATPAAVAGRLAARGYGASRVVVLEHMGGPRERAVEGTAAAWNHAPGADLNTIAVDCAAGPDAAFLPPVPGLPDSAYRHDGQLTKRAVRAATLAALGPGPGQLLWDVGAGSGAIGIEWMRADPLARAIAIEPKAGRRALIAENAAALGTPRLAIVAGEAPDALHDLEPPDAVFVGGGITTPGLVQTCWKALRPGGRLVANVVTVEGEQLLVSLMDWHGGTLTRIAVSSLEPVGGFRAWRPAMAVTQWAVTKPRGAVA